MTEYPKGLEDSLRPGKESLDGFLNKTERLEDVIKADEAVLKRFGITYDQIADRLEYVMVIAGQKSSDDSKIKNSSIYREYVHEFIVKHKNPIRGQHCPFCGSFDDFNKRAPSHMEIFSRITGEKFFVSFLHPHLIRKHHFFEGHTQFRLEPEVAIRVLNIKPGICYTPRYKNDWHWYYISQSPAWGMSLDDMKTDFLKRAHHPDERALLKIQPYRITPSIANITVYLNQNLPKAKLVIFNTTHRGLPPVRVRLNIPGMMFDNSIDSAEYDLYERGHGKLIFEQPSDLSGVVLRPDDGLYFQNPYNTV